MPSKPPVGAVGIGFSEPWLMPMLTDLWKRWTTPPADAWRAQAEIQRLELNPGDALLIRVRANLTKEMAEDIRATVQDRFPSNPVLVLTDAFTVTVLGRDERR